MAQPNINPKKIYYSAHHFARDFLYSSATFALFLFFYFTQVPCHFKIASNFISDKEWFSGLFDKTILLVIYTVISYTVGNIALSLYLLITGISFKYLGGAPFYGHFYSNYYDKNHEFIDYYKDELIGNNKLPKPSKAPKWNKSDGNYLGIVDVLISYLSFYNDKTENNNRQYALIGASRQLVVFFVVLSVISLFYNYRVGWELWFIGFLLSALGLLLRIGQLVGTSVDYDLRFIASSYQIAKDIKDGRAKHILERECSPTEKTDNQGDATSQQSGRNWG